MQASVKEVFHGARTDDGEDGGGDDRRGLVRSGRGPSVANEAAVDDPT